MGARDGCATFHPDRPIEFSTEDKVNNSSSTKRKFVRAYAFDYSQMISLDGGRSCQSRGLTSLDLRGEFPGKLLDAMMFDQTAGIASSLVLPPLSSVSSFSFLSSSSPLFSLF